jgi:hypothetical protein
MAGAGRGGAGVQGAVTGTVPAPPAPARRPLRLRFSSEPVLVRDGVGFRRAPAQPLHARGEAGRERVLVRAACSTALGPDAPDVKGT